MEPTLCFTSRTQNSRSLFRDVHKQEPNSVWLLMTRACYPGQQNRYVTPVSGAFWLRQISIERIMFNLKLTCSHGPSPLVSSHRSHPWLAFSISTRLQLRDKASDWREACAAGVDGRGEGRWADFLLAPSPLGVDFGFGLHSGASRQKPNVLQTFTASLAAWLMMLSQTSLSWFLFWFNHIFKMFEWANLF